MTINFGRYIVNSPLGEGGMADLYRAYDPLLKREVVIKVPKGERLTTVGRERFEREARSVAGLEECPEIVTLFDFGEQDGAPYLVMRYMPGGTLAESIKKAPFSLEQALPIIERVARALDYAHRRGIVHRDVKPANILFDAHDNAYLSDFGIATAPPPDPNDKRASDETKLRLTAFGPSPGTPGYRSPEQAQGEDDLDGRSDVYSLGVVLFEMLAGDVPPQASIPRIADFRADLPAAAQQLFNRALAKDRESRYARASELAADLKKLSAGVPLSPTPNVSPPKEPEDESVITEPAQEDTGEPQRSPLGLWLLGLVVLVVIGGLLRAMLVNWPPPSPTPVVTVVVVTATESPLNTPATQAPEIETVIVEVIITTTPTATPPITTTPTATPTPSQITPVAGAIRVVDRGGVRAEQVYVPAGSFRMGTNAGGTDERPVHDVSVDAFWIDRAEVTNEQFAAFVGATGLQTTAERTGQGNIYAQDSWEPVAGADWRHPQGPGSSAQHDHPVVMVTWNEAADFCTWADSRLPTEAEWEFAARGPESLPFPWGISRDTELFNSCDINCPYPWRAVAVNDGYAFTAPVGSYPGGASWVGALDMIGNVWEWVGDWFDVDAYTEAPRVNPTGPTSGALRAIRGAAWLHEPGIHYSANRGRGFPDAAYNGFGFRCAATPGGDFVPIVVQPTLASPSPASPPTACAFSAATRWGTLLSSAHEARLGCAIGQEEKSNAAFQYYQRGTMVWRGDRELVYVLYNDGSFSTHNALVGPKNYFHSDRLKGAFGYLWNNNDTVRNGLGEPAADELIATDFTVQDFAGGSLFYFFDKRGYDFALFADNNTWIGK